MVDHRKHGLQKLIKQRNRYEHSNCSSILSLFYLSCLPFLFLYIQLHVITFLSFSFAYFLVYTQKSSTFFQTFFVFAESEDAIDCDVRVLDFEFMQEPEDVVKEFRIYQEKDYPEFDVSQVSKSKQDAEKLAIELLATRLE